MKPLNPAVVASLLILTAAPFASQANDQTAAPIGSTDQARALAGSVHHAAPVGSPASLRELEIKHGAIGSTDDARTAFGATLQARRLEASTPSLVGVTSTGVPGSTDEARRAAGRAACS